MVSSRRTTAMQFAKASILCFVLLLSSVKASTDCSSIQNFCNFQFCKPDKLEDGKVTGAEDHLTLRAPNSAQYPFICRFDIGDHVSSISKVAEASVISENNRRIPISKFKPGGLTHAFPQGYFRPYRIRSAHGFQGIGRSESRGNQDRNLHGRCIVLPIRAYTVLSEQGDSTKTISTTKPKDCVAFVPEKFGVVLDINFASRGDINVRAVGPDGKFALREQGNPATFCFGGSGTYHFLKAIRGVYKIFLRSEQMKTSIRDNSSVVHIHDCVGRPGKIGFAPISTRDVFLQVYAAGRVVLRKTVKVRRSLSTVVTFTL